MLLRGSIIAHLGCLVKQFFLNESYPSFLQGCVILLNCQIPDTAVGSLGYPLSNLLCGKVKLMHKTVSFLCSRNRDFNRLL